MTNGKHNDQYLRLRRLLQGVAPLVGIAVFGVALWALHRALGNYNFPDVRHALHAIPGRNMLFALCLACLSYTLLSVYDTLALWYVGRGLHYGKIAFTSFIGCALSNNVGYPVLSGGSVRFRLYSAWGLNTMEITKVVGFCTVTSILGFTTLGGMACLYDPAPIARSQWFPLASARPLGFLLLAFPLAYLALSVFVRRPFTVRQWTFEIPRPRIALAQVAAGACDYASVAGALYLLMPANLPMPFPAFAGISVLALIVGIMSHVPGALGVFETVIVFLLTPTIPASDALGALLAFRVVYYLLPLGIAVALLAGYELHQKEAFLRRVTDLAAKSVSPIIPQLSAFSAFMAGAILLFSGVTPSHRGRLNLLRDLIPLPAVEVSHFLASAAGLGLILLSRALLRRIDAAYWLSVALLSGAVCFSAFKGLDYEEAAVMAIMLAVFLPSRSHFYRRASLLSPRLSVTWVAAVLLVVASSLWLGVFSYKHVDYSHELWWQFSFDGDASRFLRAAAGMIVLLGMVGLAELLKPAPAVPSLPRGDELEEVAAVVAQSPVAASNLALLGDKAILFNNTRNAFIMYAVEGRSWIAMGNPVGPQSGWPELVWSFRELVDLHGGWPVFYEVSSEHVHIYLDVGLTLVKMGEEARVDLTSFTIEGPERKALRHVARRMEKEGYTFRVAAGEEVAALLPQLKRVSDAWLAEKNAREKRFSLGRFDPTYLMRYPIGLVERAGIVTAFANLWQTAEGEELSVDLMRHGPDAPNGAMDFLFGHLMLWGQGRGFRWFNLGMAPLAGLEAQPLAPMWHRAGSLVYRHGEHFYNYQGLRRYKDKFGPEWRPRYLACPGGLALPRVLVNLVSLISGGAQDINQSR